VLSFQATRAFSMGIEHRTGFRASGLRFCNLLFETNNFCLGTVLLSCLVFKLQEPPSLVLELKTIFRSFYLPKTPPWSYGISMPSFGANQYISSRAMNIHTHTHTHNFNFMYNTRRQSSIQIHSKDLLLCNRHII
jgi:hypothetical protein